MKKVILFFLVLWICTSHIYSSPPKVHYNHDGHPHYYSLYLSLEKGIGASDYIRFIWPENIHTSDKS